MDTANKTNTPVKTDLEQYEDILNKFNWYYDINIDNTTWRQNDVLYRQIKDYAIINGPDYQKLFNKYYHAVFAKYFQTVNTPFPAAGFPEQLDAPPTDVSNPPSK